MKLIHNWIELLAVRESETHELELEKVGDRLACGWIINKATGETEQYLSTHTFYASTVAWSTRQLQKYGFDVTLVDWDSQEKVQR